MSFNCFWATTAAEILNSFRALILGCQIANEVPDDERIAANANLTVCKQTFIALTKESHTKILGALSAFVTSLVAYTKKGNVSENLTGRISDNIKDCTQKVVVLDIELVKLFYNQYAKRLTEETAPSFFSTVEQILPVNCQTLINLVTQTSNAGMTAALTVRDAMKEHPTFKWRELADMFPAEMQAAGSAITAVEENPYIGFKSNLGEMASTKYKNLAWVAKELLIRIDGKGSLKSYKGWTRTPANASKLETWIEEYISTINEDVFPENESARAVVGAILG